MPRLRKSIKSRGVQKVCYGPELTDFDSQQQKKSKYLVMGKRGGRTGGDLKPTFIVPWSKSKVRR